MSVVVSLVTARQALEIAAVEGIFAGINRHAVPTSTCEAFDSPAMRRPGAEQRADLRRIYVWPSAWLVASIFRDKGSFAARERWYWISERELRNLATQGGATLVEGDLV